MANFTAGTSFTDGVTNDVTAAKLNALVADAVPTSNLSLNSTTGTIATLNSTTGTIATLNSTTGTITSLSSTLAGDFTITQGTGTIGASAITTAKINDAAVTNAKLANPQYTGFRNRIINGDMRIDQRNAGASQTFTAAAALAYSVDRFYGYCTGANVTGARVVGTAPNEFVYRYTGAASVTAIGFGTRLEATNTTDLAGSTATLSVQLANSLLTSVTWTAFYATTADAFGTLASPTRTQIATGTFTVTSTLTTYSAQISVPSAATTGIEIVFIVGAQTSGTWTIDNVQLEAGSTATDFERRPYGTELALCQRYFNKSYDLAVQAGTASANGYIAMTCSGTTNQLFGSIAFPVRMRSAATLVMYSFSGTASKWSDGAGSNQAGTGAIQATEASVYAGSNTSALALGTVYLCQYTASAEL